MDIGKESKPILVTGATGSVGRELVALLATSGHPLRTLTRVPGPLIKAWPTAEHRAGDLDYADSVEGALAGIRAVFLVAAGPDILRQQECVIQAAQLADVQQIVLLSSLDVEFRAGSRAAHHAGEELLKKSGIGWTILRPNAFMSNALRWQEAIQAEGRIYEPTGDGKQAMIDPRDVAAVAAAVLTSAGHDSRIYRLTGPEALNLADCAHRLAAVLGRSIEYRDSPSETSREQFPGVRTSSDSIDPESDFYASVRAGRFAMVTTTVAQILGRPPRTFAKWAKEHASVFTEVPVARTSTAESRHFSTEGSGGQLV